MFYIASATHNREQEMTHSKPKASSETTLNSPPFYSNPSYQMYTMHLVNVTEFLFTHTVSSYPILSRILS